jgi:hypothetical protein
METGATSIFDQSGPSPSLENENAADQRRCDASYRYLGRVE